MTPNGLGAATKTVKNGKGRIRMATKVLLRKMIFAQSQVMVSSVFVGNAYT